MAGTLVRGSRRMRLATGASHIAVASAAAGTSGLLLAEAGKGIPALAAIALLTTLAAAYLGAELGLWSLPVPQTGWQVPASWRYRFPQPVTAALYGGVLAPGVGTNVPFPSFVVVLGASLMSESLVIGAVTMGTYGLARAISAVAIANFSVMSSRVDMGIGFQYRWALKLLIVVAVAAFTGACGASLIEFR